MDNIEEFDIMIRKTAKEESILLPKGFEERNNWFISNLHSSSRKRFIEFKAIKVAAFFAAFLTCGVATVAAANSLSGGAFFTKYFNSVVSEDATKDYSFMDTEQLGDLESSTIGTVIDSDEINIDVLGIIKSGNTANIMLKITANKIDSLLYNNGFETLSNYRFYDEGMGNLFENTEQVSTRYIYSNEDKELEPNQFEILYTIIKKDKFDDKEYTIELNNFGYFTGGEGLLTNFVAVYKNDWKFNISLGTNSDSFKSELINKQIEIDGFNVLVDNIKITPLSCTIYFKTDKEYSDAFLDNYLESIGDFRIEFKDGTILTSKQFKYDGSGEGSKLDAHLTFDVPININNVSSIFLFDSKVNIE